MDDEGMSFDDLPTPSFLAENGLLKPKLDSIFGEVKDAIPDIDFDISDVSSEEDVPIFHRSLRTPTSDDDRESDTSSVSSETLDKLLNTEHAKIQDASSNELPSSFGSQIDNLANVLGFSRPVSKTGNRGQHTDNLSNVLGFSKPVVKADESGDAGFENKTVDSKPTPKRNTWVTEENDQNENKFEFQDTGKRDDKKEKKRESTDNEKRSVKKKDKLSPDHNEEEKIVSMFISPAPPQLPLSVLNIDAEVAERAIVEQVFLKGAVPNKQPPKVETQEPPPAEPTESLMQKLAKFSIEQSGTQLQNIDLDTGAIKSTHCDVVPNRAPPQNTATKTTKPKTTQSSGTSTSIISTKDLPNLPRVSLSPLLSTSTNSSTNKCRDTVFLDLRGFDKNKNIQEQNVEKIQRILQIDNQRSDSSDSSSDEEDGELWHEQRRKIKESLRKTGNLPKEYKEPVEKPENISTSTPISPRGHTQAQRLAGHLPLKKKKGEEAAEVVEEDKEKDKDEKKPIVEMDPLEKEKQRRIAAAKKLREQREAERQHRIRLGERLQALRPTLTTKSKQDSAEATPIVYDIDASYEPAPENLPSVLEDGSECVLLNIHLACNGEIVAHRNANNRGVDTGHGLSASYTTLLTWFLRHVPDNFDFLKSGLPKPVPGTLTPPFHVVGLQQMFLDDKLCLYVAVMPTVDHSPMKAKKKKDETKDMTPFQQFLTKYFSRNNLQNVCPWLDALVSMEVTSKQTLNGDDGKPSFVYKPPLPNITTKPLSSFIQINPDPLAVKKIFTIPIGFFWQTIDNDELSHECGIPTDVVEFDTQSAMSLVYKNVYRSPESMMGILNRVLQEGLDLSGVRLLFPTPALMHVAAGKPHSTNQDTEAPPNPFMMLNNIGPILALCLRGTFARTVWIDAIGPSDPALARRTDPRSLCALYGGDTRDDCLLFCPRHPSRIAQELSRWFGGRVPESGVINTVGAIAQNVTKDTQKDQKSGNKKKRVSFTSESDLPTHKPPAALTATSKSDIFLVVSPLVPVKCMGMLLSTCQRRGYQLRGIKRMRLGPKKATALGVPSAYTSVFTFGGHNPTPSATEVFESSPINSKKVGIPPCAVVVLNKENSSHVAASLIENIMVQMSLLNILGDIQEDLEVPLTSSHLFHTAPFSESMLSTLGGNFYRTPDSDLGSCPGYIEPEIYTNPEMEEIVVLTLTGHHFMKNFGLFLARLLNLTPYSGKQSLTGLQEGFELIGIKWLPSLSMHQSKELTPYEVGDKQWKTSIHLLTSEPAVVLVLRGINAFKRVEAAIAQKPSIDKRTQALDRIMSATPEIAFAQVSLFFRDSELFADNTARRLLPYLPPVRYMDTHQDRYSQKGNELLFHEVQEESVIQTMLSDSRPFTTVLVLKPGVVHKHITKAMKKIAQSNFRVVGLHFKVLNEEEAKTIIPNEDLQNEVLVNMHMEYLTSDSSMILVIQRENAVLHLLELVGPVDPKEAKRLSSFNWRGVFGSDAISNGLYCSESYNDAVRDQKLFFPNGLCCKETIDLKAEGIPCPGVDVIASRQESIKRDIHLSGTTTELGTAADHPSVRKNSGTTPSNVCLPISALTQTNCVLLPPTMLQVQGRNKPSPYVELIDSITSHGGEIVGARMVWLTHEQADHYLRMVHAGTMAMINLVSMLISGPCLVLAVQCNNAVMVFENLLGNAIDKASVHHKYNSQIFRSKKVNDANEQLKFFFDQLMPGAHVQIVSKDEK